YFCRFFFFVLHNTAIWNPNGSERGQAVQYWSAACETVSQLNNASLKEKSAPGLRSPHRISQQRLAYHRLLAVFHSFTLQKKDLHRLPPSTHHGKGEIEKNRFFGLQRLGKRRRKKK
ncbi:unnamed protein product, partial [Ixodes pacificus]